MEIRMLKGPERIRLRPAVIFGDIGEEGAYNAISMLVGIFTSEAYLGYCKKISFKICNDGYVEIKSFDRGFVIDDTVIDGKPEWHNVFCEMYMYSNFEKEDFYLSSVGSHNLLYGKTDICEYPRYEINGQFELYCAMCISEFMEIEAVRNGVLKRLHFSKGCAVGDAQSGACDSDNYTFIRFKLDSSVLGEYTVSVKRIAEFLRESALAFPGLLCELEDEASSQKQSFFYENGIEDYAKELAGESGIRNFVIKLDASGKERYNEREYNAEIKIVFCFTKQNPMCLCLHNGLKLPNGGVHLDEIKKEVEYCFNLRLSECVQAEKASFESLENNVILLVETKCETFATKWQNAKHNSIKNKMIADMARDAMSKRFFTYIVNNREKIAALLKG